MIKILVVTGDGINCERETARAFSLAGGVSTIMHINDLLAAPKKLKEFQCLALPGGFSFGDDLGSGQILALKLNHGLGDEFKKFVESKKPVIGICNGFQALVKLGLLPQPFAPRSMALGRNIQGQFINRWVKLETEKSPCIWTQTVSRLVAEEKEIFELPIRHGEGRIVFAKDNEEKIHRDLSEKGQIPIRYSGNINGSYGRIAGVCDPSGLVFGLMPHPEAAISRTQYPRVGIDIANGADVSRPGIGHFMFQDCINHLRKA